MSLLKNPGCCSFRPGIIVILYGLLLTAALPTQALEIRIGYLLETRDLPPALSNLDDPPTDQGQAGARLGIADNNTTGKFTGQQFELVERRIEKSSQAADAVAELAAAGVQFLLLDVESETLRSLLQQKLPDQLLMFNVASPARDLRDQNCHPSLLHTALSRDMRSDALAQLLTKKRWSEWFLITGPRPQDRL